MGFCFSTPHFFVLLALLVYNCTRACVRVCMCNTHLLSLFVDTLSETVSSTAVTEAGKDSSYIAPLLLICIFLYLCFRDRVGGGHDQHTQNRLGQNSASTEKANSRQTNFDPNQRDHHDDQGGAAT